MLCPPAPRLRRPKNVIHTRPSRHDLSRRQCFFSESNEHLRGSSGWPRESITNPLYCTAGRCSVIWTDLLVYPFTSLKAPGLFLVRNNHERNDFLSDPINAETLMIPNRKIHLLRLVPRPPPNRGAQARGTPGARSSPAPRGLECQPPALTGPWVKTATGTEGWHVSAPGALAGRLAAGRGRVTCRFPRPLVCCRAGASEWRTGRADHSARTWPLRVARPLAPRGHTWLGVRGWRCGRFSGGRGAVCHPAWKSRAVPVAGPNRGTLAPTRPHPQWDN